FYFTLIIFTAAYAFFPVWRLQTYRFINKPSWNTFAAYLLAILFLSTAAYTITMFIVMVPTWLVMTIVLLKLRDPKILSRGNIKRFLGLVLGLFVVSAFWTVPFLYYAANNADDIQSSYINRNITPNII